MSRFLRISFCVSLVLLTASSQGQSLSTRRAQQSRRSQQTPPKSLDELLATDTTLRDVTFVDAQHGWAVGDRGGILHTDDGGAHWHSQRSGIKLPLLSVSFADANRGWAVGGTATPITHRTEGVVLRTVDGGITWQRMQTPTLPRLTHVQFFDAAHGVATGYGSSFYPAGLFTTNDGGKSWQAIGSPEQVTWLASDFVNASNGLLAGTNSARAVLIDRELRLTPIATTDTRQPRAIAIAGGTTAWLAGDEGLVLHTTDSGVTWQPPATRPIAVSPQLERTWQWKSIAVVGQHVWLAGAPGSVVAHSADAGATWQLTPTGIGTPIEKLVFIDEQRGWAVGHLGTILATVDGGRTWRQQRGTGRAAMLALTASPEQMPLEIIARYAAGDGYRTAVMPLFAAEPDTNTTIDAHRTAEAIASIASSQAGQLWNAEVPAPGYHASPETLLAELNRQTDGLAREQLIAKLATAIRTWRPAVLLVPHERNPQRHAASALAEHLALEAVRVAADPTQSAELAMVGLEAWQVKRIVGLLPNGERGSIRLPTDDFVATLGGSPAGWTSAARGLLFAKHTVPPPLEELELLQQSDGLASSTRDLFAGLNLPSGSDARRVAIASNPADLDRLRRLTQKRRQLVRLLDYAEGSPVWSAQVVNLTGGLDAASGGELLYQLAEGYRETGRHAMAADTLYLLVRRYPEHPLSEQALVWLVRYYASGEVAHMTSRLQAQQTRTRPLANVEYEPSDSAQRAAAELTDNASGGTGDLTADQRLQRATMLGDYIQKARPAVYAEPNLRFPLSVASRRLGFTNTADRYFAILSKANVNTAWGTAARAENWLAEPDKLPPNKPLVTCKAVANKPHLDGVFDEPFWQRSEPVRIASAEGRDDTTAATVQLARDEQYLYVAISCPRLRDEAYPVDAGPRNRDADLTPYDRVHLAIDIDRDYGTAYELIVDCRGWTHDACWGIANWDPKWFVAHNLGETSWTAELAIPWAELASPEPAVLDTWCLRAVRKTSRGQQASWTGAAGGTPESFGLLLFR